MMFTDENIKEILESYKDEIYSDEEAISKLKELVFPFVSIENIVTVVCKAMMVSEEHFYSRKKYFPIPECRQMVTIFAYEKGYSYPKIAEAIQRSHSSLIVGRRSLEGRMEVDIKLREKFLRIKKLVE